METEMKYCPTCDSDTIHLDGECLRCKKFREMQQILDAIFPIQEDDGA